MNDVHFQSFTIPIFCKVSVVRGTNGRIGFKFGKVKIDDPFYKIANLVPEARSHMAEIVFIAFMDGLNQIGVNIFT